MMPTGTPTQEITKTKVTPTTINASATPIMARSHPAHPARHLDGTAPPRRRGVSTPSGSRDSAVERLMRLWGGGGLTPGGEVFIGANGCVGHAGRLAMLAIEPLTQMKGCKGRGEGQMRDSAVSITACRRVRRRAVSRSSLASRRQRPREAQAERASPAPKASVPAVSSVFWLHGNQKGREGRHARPRSQPVREGHAPVVAVLLASGKEKADESIPAPLGRAWP